MTKQRKINKPTFTNFKTLFVAMNKVMATGSIQLKSGDFAQTRVSIDYLRRAIKTAELHDIDEITIVQARGDYDFPLMMGELNEDVVTGIIVAPRA